MSESSESLQIKLPDLGRCTKVLRELGVHGFVFRGTRGWQTAVPFGGPAGMAGKTGAIRRLAATVPAPVLEYQCYEDFGWGFSLWLPDGRSTAFQAMTPEAFEDARNFAPGSIVHVDEAILSEVIPLATVRPFLHEKLSAETSASEPASAFAAALGFPEYRWLSPSYITTDPGEARRRGGQQI